jgi:hypothetical protein
MSPAIPQSLVIGSLWTKIQLVGSTDELMSYDERGNIRELQNMR